MTFTTPDIGTQLARFSPTDVAIAAMRERYMPLTIAGLADVDGYNAVHAARLRKIDEERIAAEAAERSRIETEQRIARQAELMEVTRIKAESMRPDCEKLHAIALAVSAIAVPPVCHEAAEFARRIQDVLSRAVEAIDKIVSEMTPEPF